MRKQLRVALASILCATGTLAIQSTALAQGRSKDPANKIGNVVSGELIVVFPQGTANATVDQVASNVGCEVIRPLAYTPGGYLLGLKTRKVGALEAPTPALMQAVASLSQMPGVSAGPNYLHEIRSKVVQSNSVRKGRATEPQGTEFIPNDPLFATKQQWDMRMIRMPEAWDFQYGDGTPTKIAVIDTGVDTAHPDFKLPDGSSIIVDARDFTGSTTGPNYDPDGHGTHVGGTMAAATNNSTGVVGIAGLRRGGVNVQLMALRIGSDSGALSSAASLQAINYAAQNGARAINMSYGGPLAFTPAPEVQALTDAIKAGVVAVGASGNSSQDLATQADFPTDVDGVIKVNSVGPTRKLAYYSNYGGKNKKIIASPGGDDRVGQLVHSTYPTRLGSYIDEEGTSMAAPHVAGAAGLLLAAGVASADVYQVLADTASVPNDTPNTDKYGPGIIDVYSALKAADPRPSITIEGGLDRGASFFRATPIKLTMRGLINVVADPAAQAPKVNESNIVVEIQNVGRTSLVIKRFVGGRNGAGDFELPVVSPTASRGTVIAGIEVPRRVNGVYTPYSLPPGQYKIVGRVTFKEKDGTTKIVESTQFLTVTEKRLSTGRTMFAVPFRAGAFLRTKPEDATLTPEGAILGRATSFSLARFNPVRTPSDDDYARYRANDPFGTKSAARFDINDYPSNRIISYDTTAPSLSIAPIGIGYWLDLDQAAVIDTTLLPYPGQVAGVSPVAENSVAINAYASGGGWNMIGAPFVYPVDWSVVSIIADGASYSMSEAVNNGILSPALVGFANGDYIYAIAPAGQLDAFNSYWIRVYRDCTIVVPPVPSASITRGRQLIPSGDGWKARLVASVSGDVDGQNYFGQSTGAQDMVDRLDILKPPAGAGHAYLRFLNDSHDGKTRSLAYDMRSPNRVTKQEWLAAVSSDRANATVVLSWDGLGAAPKNARLVLKDTLTGQVVTMGSRSSYTFRSGEAGSSRLIKISLEPQLSNGILAFRNLRTATGRSVSGWSIRFSTNIESDVEGRIETLNGRPVATLVGSSRAEAGNETTLRWDGKSKDGALVPAGPYMVKLTARSADGQLQTKQLMIQLVR